jgi:hypothetical protein
MAILDTLSAIPPYAYSLRTLTTTYSGPLVTLKNSSTSATQSFSAVGGSVSVAAIEAFAAGAVCSVIEWFNQGSAGNTGDLLTAGPGVFPDITNSEGNVFTQNGLPALNFPGPDVSNTGFVSGTTFSVWNTATSANFVFAETSISNFGAPFIGGNTATLDTVVVWAGFRSGEPAVLNAGSNNSSFNTAIPITVPNILTFTSPALSGGDLTVSGFLNSTSIGTASVTGVTGTPVTGFSLGLDIFQENGAAFQGTMTEVILWNSVVSTADREALELNQGSLYGVAGFPTLTVGTMAGVGAISGVGVAMIHAIGTLSGTSTLSADGLARINSVATLSGEGVLLGNGLSLAQTSGTLTGTSALSGSSLSIIFTSGTLDGTSDLDGDGVAATQVVGILSGVGTLSADGLSIASAAGNISGLGDLLGISGSSKIVTTAGLLSGTSSLQASGIATTLAAATLTGEATLTGNSLAITLSQGLLDGESTLAATSITNSFISPSLGTLSLDGQVSIVITGFNLSPEKGVLLLEGFSPTLSAPTNIIVLTGLLEATGFSPILVHDNLITPNSGKLIITGFSPTLPSLKELAIQALNAGLLVEFMNNASLDGTYAVNQPPFTLIQFIQTYILKHNRFPVLSAAQNAELQQILQNLFNPG